MSKSAIRTLARDSSNQQALEELASAVADASQTGHGQQGDNLIDWLSNGDYDGTETVESIAIEWDSGRD
jgi:hypothetical protein